MLPENIKETVAFALHEDLNGLMLLKAILLRNLFLNHSRFQPSSSRVKRVLFVGKPGLRPYLNILKVLLSALGL